MHVCPLQLDIIKRLITRYTNPGDIVLDPFGGIIGSVPFQALKMGRKAVGIELNEEYWRCGVGYCEMAENEDTDVGDKVTGVMVRNSNGTPVVQLDIRNYKKDSNLTVEIEAAELMAALTQALVHAERE
jgi:hypothetical protein